MASKLRVRGSKPELNEMLVILVVSGRTKVSLSFIILDGLGSGVQVFILKPLEIIWCRPALECLQTDVFTASWCLFDVYPLICFITILTFTACCYQLASYYTIIHDRIQLSFSTKCSISLNLAWAKTKCITANVTAALLKLLNLGFQWNFRKILIICLNSRKLNCGDVWDSEGTLIYDLP